MPARDRAGAAGRAGRRRPGDVYYAALLRFAGCAATSHEMAAALRRRRRRGARPRRPDRRRRGRSRRCGSWPASATAPGGCGCWAARRARRGSSPSATRADCEVGADLTRRLRLPDAVSRAVLDGFERFDGRGAPAGRAGEEIAEAARFAAVGFAAVMFDAVGGAESRPRRSPAGRAARSTRRSPRSSARRRRSCSRSRTRTTSGRRSSTPSRRRGARSATTAALDDALAGFGDAADLKTPWFHGHSRRRRPARPGRAPTRAAVDPRSSTGPGCSTTSAAWPSRPASGSGRAAARGGVGAGAPAPVPLGPDPRPLAGARAARPDREPPPRARRRVGLSGRRAALRARRRRLPARRGRRAARARRGAAAPRRARPGAAASRVLVRHAARPRRDPRRARGGRRARAPRCRRCRPTSPSASSRCCACWSPGARSAQIAAELVISPSTVHTHTVHIYDKCGVSTRAGLAMFAMRARAAPGRPKID